MLEVFAIGLSQALVAAVITAIIAAFLKRSAQRDGRGSMSIGVANVVILCLGIDVTLLVIYGVLPERREVILRILLPAVSAVIISCLIVWMRRHFRGPAQDSASGPASAPPPSLTVALTAVSLFPALLAALGALAIPVILLGGAGFAPPGATLPFIGAGLASIAVAVVIGVLIYRGAMKVDVARHFRIIGALLVLVAAGLVTKTLQVLNEAGWLTFGQPHSVDVRSTVGPESLQSSLLTGVFGFSAQPALVEILGFVLYAVPMMLVVLRAPRNAPTRPAARNTLETTDD